MAAYSLNDPAVLAAATAEIVEWLAREGLIGPDRDVLDLGCGIGRVSAAIARRCRSVLGLDVSPKMVAEARRRHGAVPGLGFDATPGTGLAAIACGSFDLVLAVDSFPYLLQAGRAGADQHLADAARVLRPRRGARYSQPVLSRRSRGPGGCGAVGGSGRVDLGGEWRRALCALGWHRVPAAADLTGRGSVRSGSFSAASGSEPASSSRSSTTSWRADSSSFFASSISRSALSSRPLASSPSASSASSLAFSCRSASGCPCSSPVFCRAILFSCSSGDRA